MHLLIKFAMFTSFLPLNNRNFWRFSKKTKKNWSQRKSTTPKTIHIFFSCVPCFCRPQLAHFHLFSHRDSTFRSLKNNNELASFYQTNEFGSLQLLRSFATHKRNGFANSMKMNILIYLRHPQLKPPNWISAKSHSKSYEPQAKAVCM